jgi:hypothetical protein
MLIMIRNLTVTEKYPWLYDSVPVVLQGYLCKFCELFCGHSSSSQEFVTVGINLGTVWSLFYYWTSKLINLLLFPSFPNSHHLRVDFKVTLTVVTRVSTSGRYGVSAVLVSVTGSGSDSLETQTVSLALLPSSTSLPSGSKNFFLIQRIQVSCTRFHHYW